MTIITGDLLEIRLELELAILAGDERSSGECQIPTLVSSVLINGIVGLTVSLCSVVVWTSKLCFRQPSTSKHNMSTTYSLVVRVRETFSLARSSNSNRRYRSMSSVCSVSNSF